MAFSFLYDAFGALLGVLVRSRRGLDVKDPAGGPAPRARVLRRQVARPRLRAADRALLAAAACHLPRQSRRARLLTRGRRCVGVGRSCEGVLYADARAQPIELLDLRPGARVLDVARGTGANFALIEQRIGPSGDLVGVDVTPRMLNQARARVARAGWSNVRLREGDACELGAERLSEPIDAAVWTLGLSVIAQWQRAWEAMVSSVRPAARLAIMDAGYPDGDGRRRDAVIPRIAWALSRLFAADCSRRPSRLLQLDTGEPTSERFTWGWGHRRRRSERSRMSLRAQQLQEAADRQIAELAERCRLRASHVSPGPAPATKSSATAPSAPSRPHPRQQPPDCPVRRRDPRRRRAAPPRSARRGMPPRSSSTSCSSVSRSRGMRSRRSGSSAMSRWTRCRPQARSSSPTARGRSSRSSRACSSTNATRSPR
jgi:SAM-dependent methyltransferase